MNDGGLIARTNSNVHNGKPQQQQSSSLSNPSASLPSIGGGGGIGASSPALPHHHIPQQQQSLKSEFLYTKAVPKPLLKDVFRELRCIVRISQLLLAAGAFISLALATSNTKYNYAVLGTSGVNLMCLTSLSSMFVSFSCIFLYCNPAFLGVPPHRHPRFSRIEVVVDLLYIGFWILASSYMIAFGDCPQQLVNAFKSISPAAAGAASIGTSASSSSLNENEKNSCATWNTSLAFGYISVFFFLATFVMGVKDLWQHGWFQGFTFQGTRGNWKDQEDED